MGQPYIILDWCSFKLPRISRSSLNSEAQACSAAMDALEYLTIFWHGCMVRDFDLRYLDTQDIAMQSAPVIDAKAFFDSIKAEVPQLQGDKRTKIEIMIVKQKMDENGTKLRWISSEIQLPHGVTQRLRRASPWPTVSGHTCFLFKLIRLFRQQSERRKLNEKHQLVAMPLDAWSTKAAWATWSWPTSLCQFEAKTLLMTISLTSSSHVSSSSLFSSFGSAFNEWHGPWGALLAQPGQLPHSCRAPRLRPSRTVRFQRCASTWKINVIELTCWPSKSMTRTTRSQICRNGLATVKETWHRHNFGAEPVKDFMYNQNVIPFDMPILVASEGLQFAHIAVEICIRAALTDDSGNFLPPPMWMCHQTSLNSVIAGNHPEQHLHLGLACIARRIWAFVVHQHLSIPVHRALERYKSHGNAEKTSSACFARCTCPVPIVFNTLSGWNTKITFRIFTLPKQIPGIPSGTARNCCLVPTKVGQSLPDPRSSTCIKLWPMPGVW